jgi:hypothetical protein
MRCAGKGIPSTTMSEKLWYTFNAHRKTIKITKAAVSVILLSIENSIISLLRLLSIFVRE